MGGGGRAVVELRVEGVGLEGTYIKENQGVKQGVITIKARKEWIITLPVHLFCSPQSTCYPIQLPI